MANPALIDELEKQFRDNPRRVFARLANEYRKAGDFMRAIEICHAHVPQQPGYISGHIVLGQALYDAGELDQAHQTFQTALSLDPENLIALRQLGDIARNRRDYREARSWYTRLLEVDPQNDEIVAQLGEIALAEGDGAGQGVEDGSASSETQEEQSGVATATAVADDEDDDERIPAIAGFDDSATDPGDSLDGRSHNDFGARLDSPALDSASDHDAAPEFASIRDLEPDAPEFSVGAGDAFREEQRFGSHESVSAAPDAPSRDEPDEDDVAWIAAETVSMDTVDFMVSDADEADATDFVVAEAAQDDAQSLAPPTDDFDFAFETEEFEEQPLRPHTGESLSIIAEEDPLAGVQPTRAFDRSPFGDPIEPPSSRDSETSEASFEPLPIADIDAASAELPPVAELGGEDLVEEMTRWSSATPETDSEAISGAPYESPDLAHADIFIDSEAETIIEETTISESILDEPGDAETLAEEATAAFAWGAPEAEAAPDTAEDAEPDFVWTPDVAEAEAPAASESNSSTPTAHEDATPATFVTETMAELYLRQGFRNEALDVYRRLAAQSPDDAALRARIAELENGAPSPEESSGVSVPAMQRPAAAFFKSLASVQPPPPPTPDDSGASDFGQWDSVLSDAGDVSERDDAAAMALSNGFHAPQPRGAATRAADRKMSLHDIFGASEQTDRGAAAGSLDAFFTPEGERANGPQGDEEGREDLEAFNAWLEGLKK